MTAAKSEPWNPFYVLLLVSGLVFVLTAVAVAFVPVLEQKAAEAGNPPPPSALRDSLRSDGWWWLLVEVGAVVVFGLLSMVYDRLRGLKNPSQAATIPTSSAADPTAPSPPTGGAAHDGTAREHHPA